MSSENKAIDAEKHKDELASTRRIAAQIIALQKWVLNASLASLGFAFTAMLQVKQASSIPNLLLAEITIGLLILAVFFAIFTRTRHELGGFFADSKGFFSFLPILSNMVKDSPEVSKTGKALVTKFFNRAIDKGCDMSPISESWNPYIDLLLFIASLLSLFIGIGCLCAYVWLYLFGA